YGDLVVLNIGLAGSYCCTHKLVPCLFGELESDTVTVGTNRDGTNINEGVGSTHPEKLIELVQEEKCDFGLAFDGDGDRLIAVDENGNILDGDKIMFIIAQYLRENGELKDDMLVYTVITNLGS